MYRRKSDLEAIVEQFMPAVRMTVRKMGFTNERYYANGITRQDAIQIGVIGIIKGAQSYRGEYALNTWIGRRIKWEILEQIRKTGWGKRRHEFTPSEQYDDDLDGRVRWEYPDHDIIRTLENLEMFEGDKTVIDLLCMQGMTIKEAADTMGVSEARISQRYSRAKKQIKEALSA